MKKIYMFCAAALLFALQACRETGFEEPFIPEKEGKTSLDVPVKLETLGPDFMPDLKSSVHPDESGIRNLMMVAYESGILHDYVFLEQPLSRPDQLKLELFAGETYNIYVLANARCSLPSVQEKEFLYGCKVRISSLQDLEEGIPMSCRVEGYHAEKPVREPLVIRLRRLASKVNFSFDTRNIPGFKATSVRIRQCAASVHPFPDPSVGSRISTSADVIEGDRASAEDLLALNGGGKISFYTLENCQGTLLPGNTDPWKKIPESIPGKMPLCTYLELDGEFSGNSLHQGKVKYRFFLGQNNSDDFNIRGNSILDVTLVGTDDHFGELSWKIESDTSLNPASASSRISLDSMHRDGEFYVGEYFKAEFRTSPELAGYIGDIPGKTRMIFSPSAGGQISFGSISTEQGYYSCTACCRMPGQGSIWLTDLEGEKLLELLPDIRISVPELKTNLDGTTACQINGPEVRMEVFLSDRQGRALEDNPLGFDASLFSISVAETFPDDSLVMPETLPDRGYGLLLRCANDGKTGSRNRRLHELATEGTCLQIPATESNFGLHCEGLLPLSIRPVEIHMEVYHSQGFRLEVDNSSNLPLDMNIYELQTTGPLQDLSLRPGITNDVEKRLAVLPCHYIGSAYSTGIYPVYSDGTRILSGYAPGCTSHTTDHLGRFLYEVYDINRPVIQKAEIYNYLINDSMCHAMDVRMLGQPLDDALLKVTANCYFDEWKWDGIMVYSCDRLLEKTTMLLDPFPGMSPDALDKLRTGTGALDLNLYFNNDDYGLYVQNYGPDSQGTKVCIKTEGYIQGRALVRSSPGAKEKMHYCTERFETETRDIPLGVTGMKIDAGGIADALSRIHQKRFDHYKGGKRQVKIPYPTDIKIEVSIRIAGNPGNVLYPISWNPDAGYLFYHHAEDNLEYQVSDVMEVKVPEYVNVKRISY